MKCLSKALFALPLLCLVSQAWSAPRVTLAHRGKAASPTPGDTASVPQLLRDIPQLQQKVNVDAVDRPLGDVLSTLSPTLNADLTASSEVADQRVTLHLTDQPLYAVMGRLVSLLSHDIDRPHGYHWGPLDRAVGERPVFQLWRDSASVAEEEDARGYPARELAKLLRDIRNMAELTPQGEAKYQGDYPYHPDPEDAVDSVTNKAFKGLSDEQIDALVAGRALPLSPFLFAGEHAAFKQDQQDANTTQQRDTIAAGHPDPFPQGLPVPPEVPLTLSVSLADEDGADPSQDFKYGVHLKGVLEGEGTLHDTYLLLNTYDTTQNREPDRLYPWESKLPVGTGPVFDLRPLLTAKGVTVAQRSDVGFTLQALAKVARINVYQEAFLRPDATSASDGFTPSDQLPDDVQQVGLQTLSGTLEKLTAAICVHWNFQCRKVGDDYVFWSRTWPLDRAADVSDRQIDVWRRRLTGQGSFTLDDYAEVAAALTWPQIALTLRPALPGAAPAQFNSYTALRTLGLLSRAERDAALSEQGLPLSLMPLTEQEAFAASFRKELADVSGDQMARASLLVRLPDDPEIIGRRVVLGVVADGQSLMTKSVPVFIPAAPKPASIGMP